MRAFRPLLLALAVPWLACAQGSFTNLDFESANLPLPSHGFELVTDALPGWTVLYGTNVETLISRNNYGFEGKSRATIWERNINPVPLAGRYFLEFTRFGRDLTPVSIAQNGLVPSDSLSLRFLTALTPWIPGDMTIQLNGTELQLQVLGFTSSATIVGADVSAFAGQTAKLQITSQPYRESGGIVTYLDNIAFSPEPVPEPATLALLELGGALALAGWRGCRRKG